MTNQPNCAVRAEERSVMAIKIVLTVDENLTVQEADDLKVLLKDAFGEFASRRLPARDYVDQRYPGTDYFPDREKKVEQVERRCGLARKLNAAADDVEVLREHERLAK